ncbi:MAG TPA: radical SAM protein [Polyangiaceae bacterium]|nr:radical SAM protein [Polyangiaceae bacterium]
MSRRVLEGVATGRPVTGPETVHIDITNGCNTNCITCCDHSPHLSAPRDASWKRSRLPLDRFEALLSDLDALGGLRAIVLSGMGEPFTHPDVYAMIEAIKRRGLHLTIITNLVAADAERIARLGVDQLLIGIHGATERSYLAFHPSFRDVEWKKLHAMLGTFASRGLRFKHVQVVSRPNADEVVDMVELAHRYRAAQVNFKLASLGHGTEAAAITEEQRLALARELVPRAAARARSLGVVTNLDVFAMQLDAGGRRTAPIEDVGCFMGFAYARVLVDGTVLYCCNTDVVVGALRSGATFGELWRGDAWNRLRDRFRRGDYFASCGQCGKLNQNVKLARRFEAAHGAARLYEVTGRGLDGEITARTRRLPLVGGPAGDLEP